MSVAPFFERVYGAVGGHLTVSRESLEHTLQQTTIGIRLGGNLDENAFWIAELTTNLVARLYSRIAIVADEPNAARLRRIASDINPRIEFVDDAPGSTSVSVGAETVPGALYPSASGWVARLAHAGPLEAGPANPYAACASAALACAELFRRVFTKSDPEHDVAVSLLDFGPDTGSELEIRHHELGRVWFAGLGAVGNAALWTLARDTKCTGQVWLIDHEDLTLLNLQRYVLGSHHDIGKPKTELGRTALSRTALSVELSKTTLEEFADANGSDIEVICVSVDNVSSRRSAQGLLPRLVLNGWTGDRALGASWHHLTGPNSCLACLYHPRGQGRSATEQAAEALGLSADRAALLWVSREPLSAEDLRTAAVALGVSDDVLAPWTGKSLGDLYTDVVCGAVPLDVGGVGRVETVPLAHQSALAGILMATELVKRTNPDLLTMSQVEPLISWDDVLRPPPTIWTKPRAHEGGCICGDPDYRAVYQRKWFR
jgi:ThiF family